MVQSKEEQETIIRFDRASGVCTIYTADKTVMTKLNKRYTCISADQYGKTYQTNKKYISFRADPYADIN